MNGFIHCFLVVDYNLSKEKESGLEKVGAEKYIVEQALVPAAGATLGQQVTLLA